MLLEELDMGLSKLGQYIEQIEYRNSCLEYGVEDVRGVSNNKEIMPTKADNEGRDLNRFYIIGPDEFVYNSRTTRMGEKVGLGYNNTGKSFITSWNNSAFRIKKEALKYFLPAYLFIYFNRPEFDRYARYNSWGSSTELFTWDDMCDIDIDLPPLPIQQKYVDVYNAMLANQRAYERGLEDLKLTCDAYIERLRHEIENEPIGSYLQRHDQRNSDNKIKNVMGVSVYKQFRVPTSKVNVEELSNYKIVKPRQISFVQTTHNEKVFAYAFNNTDCDVVVSSVNEVFSTDESRLLPEYLSLFFNRTEFDRYARFHSLGSARETFTWSDLIEVKFPIPDINVQKSIVNIYDAFVTRREINEKLKKQIKDICPILIKGSLEEAKRLKK